MRMTPEVRVALDLLRKAAEAQGETHFDDHLIEFRNDGWTIQHPISERLDGSLFECLYAIWDGGDIGYRGRYEVYFDEDGQMCIGDQVLA